MEINIIDTKMFDIVRLQDDANTILGRIKRDSHDLIFIRWEQGRLISEIAMDTQQWAEKIAQAAGVSVGTVYRIKAFYECKIWNRDLDILKGWMENMELNSGKMATWSAVSSHAVSSQKAALPEKREIERANIEAAAERLETRVENFMSVKPDIEEDTYFDSGVATAAVGVVDEVKTQMNTDRVVNAQYIKFIKKQLCCISGESDSISVIRVGGTSDYCSIPISQRFLDEIEVEGQSAVFRKYKVNPYKVMAKMLHLYFVGVEI